MIEAEISKLTRQWRPQVVAFIKEKDRMLNPAEYEDPSEDLEASGINSNLFDDFNDEIDHDTSNSSDSSSQSPIINRRQNNLTNNSSTMSCAGIDSSREVSGVQEANINQLSKAEARSKAIDDELERYANFSKLTFSKFCSDRGLTRSDPNIFEPIGKITWEFWRTYKESFPILYASIKAILQAPTSSSAIERLFSRVSAFVTKQKNCFKSKNLLALLHISEMDDFQRVSADSFRQNGIQYDVIDEVAAYDNTTNETEAESGIGSESLNEQEQLFCDLLDFSA